MDKKPGPWELLVLPQYLQPEMVHVIVQLAEHGDVSAAICNNPYLIRLLGLMGQDGQYKAVIGDMANPSQVALRLRYLISHSRNCCSYSLAVIVWYLILNFTK